MVDAESSRISHKDRLSLLPPLRVSIAAMLAGGYGFATGFFKGAGDASLKYLAENAHRMPKTKGGWYFYHKRKNYILAKNGMFGGLKKATKLGTIAAAYFGLEAYLDHARGVIDAGNTIISSTIIAIVYGISSGLDTKAALKSARTFILFGTVIGLLQDYARYTRGNDVWYLSRYRKSFI